MHKRKVNTWAGCTVRRDQLAATSRLRILSGAHSATTSNGWQQTSQSVVKRCDATLVSMTSSKRWPQNGQRMAWEVSIVQKQTRRSQRQGKSLFELALVI